MSNHSHNAPRHAAQDAKHKSPKHEQKILDKALEDSFPASDPPAQAAPETKPVIDPKSLKKNAADAHEKRKEKH